MTPAGYTAVVAELKQLKEVTRHKIVRDIEEARAHGDISENAEFEDAKHRQAHCEGRIMDLEGKVSAAEVIDIHKLEPSDRVVFGVTVDLEDLEAEGPLTYTIVGTDEADVKAGKISVTSPLGRALVGKEAGDEIMVETPRGTRRFAIDEVHYG